MSGKIIIYFVFVIIMAASVSAQDIIPDSSEIIAETDSLNSMPDSMQLIEDAAEEVERYNPPIKIIDTMATYFVRRWHDFDISKNDLYPRDAGGFVISEASYYTSLYHETPQRTTVSPFGLPGGFLSVQSGNLELLPFDRAIPADGRTDFGDISTGDITRAGLIEGPLSAFNSFGGGLALLYLKSLSIPDGPAASQFIIERGAFGYAYTRGRIARKFSDKLGFAFSTDYRNGEGYNPDANDNSYNVKTKIISRVFSKTTIESSINIYRRKGEYPVMPDSGGYTFRRFRRDNHYNLSITQHALLGGELSGQINYQDSRSSYSSYSTLFSRTILPKYYFADIGYTSTGSLGLFYLGARIGQNKFDFDNFYLSQNYSMITAAKTFSIFGGRQFTFVRFKSSETDHPAIEGAIGWSQGSTNGLRLILSAGYITGFPKLDERYIPTRFGRIGSLSGDYFEGGNVGLQPEKKLTGNLALAYSGKNGEISVSANAGRLDDAIYYDRSFSLFSAGEITPKNDTIIFTDINLLIKFVDFGPFYGSGSATVRKVDSDRYGIRPPYSPRWQAYGQAGLDFTINRYEIDLRLFGDISYSEKPLSYKLEELETYPLVSWGVNASMQSFTFYYLMHNALGRINPAPEGAGYSSWFYSWGINWKFVD